MPMYEFRCEACGTRFERLVAAGSSAGPCPTCGSEGARRLFSPPAAPFTLVRTPRDARRQERRNAQLNRNARERFKAARRRGRGTEEGSGGS